VVGSRAEQSTTSHPARRAPANTSPAWHGEHIGIAGRAGADTLRLAHTDWLRHELVITGVPSELAAFEAAAAGAGAIPWEYPDLDLEEEDRVQALVQPPDGSRGLDIDSARVLARELREAIFDHQQKIVAAVAQSRACPFDLHKLLPVPSEILQLGPDHSASLSWLQTHWGTTRPLRHVQRLADKPVATKRKTVRLRLEFWSADWTPWAAFAAIRKAWPTLGFDIRPDYYDG
jgi:hypothetical protein